MDFDRDDRKAALGGRPAPGTNGQAEGGTANAMEVEAPQRRMNRLLDELFSYHPPTPEQLPKYRALRSAAKHFAEVLIDNTPPCRDQDAALDHIRIAVMLGNASIALHGRI